MAVAEARNRRAARRVDIGAAIAIEEFDALAATATGRVAWIWRCRMRVMLSSIDDGAIWGEPMMQHMLHIAQY